MPSLTITLIFAHNITGTGNLPWQLHLKSKAWSSNIVKKQDKADEVFKLPFVFAPKSPRKPKRRGRFGGEGQTQTPVNVQNECDMDQGSQKMKWASIRNNILKILDSRGSCVLH